MSIGPWPAGSWAATRPLSGSCSTASSRGCTALRWRESAAIRTRRRTSCSRLSARRSSGSTVIAARRRSTPGSARSAAMRSRTTIADGRRATSASYCWRTSPTCARYSRRWRRPSEDEPDTGVWRQQVHRVVEATLDALPGHYGEVLEWKYLDGESVEEIARRLELGPEGGGVAADESQGCISRRHFGIGGRVRRIDRSTGPEPGVGTWNSNRRIIRMAQTLSRR